MPVAKHAYSEYKKLELSYYIYTTELIRFLLFLLRIKIYILAPFLQTKAMRYLLSSFFQEIVILVGI